MIRGMLIAAAWGVICAAALAAVVTGEERSGREVKVVCFGDSITEGYSVDGQLKTTYPGLLQGVLDEIEGKGRFKVVNCGISGQDTRQGLARIDRVLEEEKPDWMLVLYGTNDLWTGRKISVEETEANLREMLSRVKGAGARCIIGTMIPVWGFDEKVGERNKIIRKVAKEAGVPVAETGEAFEGAIRKAGERAKRAAWESVYQVEGDEFVHPNDAGNRLLAERWGEALRGAIAGGGSGGK